MTAWEAITIRAGCAFVFFLLVFLAIVLWQIRQAARARPGDNLTAAGLFVVVLALGVSASIFAKCAWTGMFPCVKEARP